jgi:FAD/FMN-containing dehydrogenase
MEVASDAQTLRLYSRDASPFAVEPAAVARVRDAAEVVECLQLGLPVTARAGGSSVAGQCLGAGLIVDTSGLGGVELDGDAVWAGAGVVLDELNGALASSGVMIGPDVTSSQWARVGGLVGTNACGSRSLRFGRFGDALLEADVVMADGSVSTLSRGSAVWPSLAAVLDGLEEDVAEAWPQQHRGFGGYALDAFARRGDPLALVPGSEGTLCVVTRARLAVVPRPSSRVISRAEFPSLRAALDVAPSCAASGASAVEVLDSHLTGGDPVLLVEHLDEPAPLPRGFSRLSPADGEAAWAMRRSALARLEAAGTNAIALFEDPAVAPERAGAFADELLALLSRFDFDAVVYGHAAAGCLHVRPLVSRAEPRLAERLLQALEEVAELVASYEGAITGEHGWGLARSHLAERALGPELYERCRAVKRAWDPDGILNPGRIVDADRPEPSWISALWGTQSRTATGYSPPCQPKCFEPRSQ